MEIVLYIAVFVAFTVFTRVMLLKNKAAYMKMHQERAKHHEELMDALKQINKKLDEIKK